MILSIFLELSKIILLSCFTKCTSKYFTTFKKMQPKDSVYVYLCIFFVRNYGRVCNKSTLQTAFKICTACILNTRIYESLIIYSLLYRTLITKLIKKKVIRIDVLAKQTGFNSLKMKLLKVKTKLIKKLYLYKVLMDILSVYQHIFMTVLKNITLK